VSPVGLAVEPKRGEDSMAAGVFSSTASLVKSLENASTFDGCAALSLAPILAIVVANFFAPAL